MLRLCCHYVFAAKIKGFEVRTVGLLVSAGDGGETEGRVGQTARRCLQLEGMPPCLPPSLTMSARGLGLNFIRWEISVDSQEQECLFQAAPPFIS